MFDDMNDPLHILEVRLYDDGSVDVYGISTYRHPLHHSTIDQALESIKESLNKEYKASLEPDNAD